MRIASYEEHSNRNHSDSKNFLDMLDRPLISESMHMHATSFAGGDGSNDKTNWSESLSVETTAKEQKVSAGLVGASVKLDPKGGAL